MAKKVEVKQQFVPVLARTEVDLSHRMELRTAFKLIQVVQDANLSRMFDGFALIFKKNGLNFSDLIPGEVVMFLNRKRDYIKLIVGNGTADPVIAAYRFPKGMRLPTKATDEVVRSFVKTGAVQMDDRLRIALGDKLAKKRTRTIIVRKAGEA